MEAIKQGFLKRILTEKCPNCSKSDVYEKSPNRFLYVPHMKERCEHCHYKFEREQGYFIGAMYLSYGLAVLQGILTYISVKLFFPNLSDWTMIALTCSVMVLFSFPNFRISRIIWMHIFPN